MGVSCFFSILPAEETVFWARINIARGFFLGWCGGFCGFMLGFFFFLFPAVCFPLHWGPVWLKFLGATVIKIW